MHRILVQHMNKFKTQATAIPRHIHSKHSKEMASRSVVVSAISSTKLMKLGISVSTIV